MIDTPHGWLVIACKGGQEERAKRELEKQEYLPGSRYRCYLPWAVTRRMKRGKVYDAREPLFPCYLFLAKDEGVNLEELNVHAIKNTRGVIGVVSVACNGLPNMLTNRHIEFIQNDLCTEGGCHRIDSPYDPVQTFEPHEKVSIKNGSFAGFPAEFVKYARGRKGKIAVVEVHMFGRLVHTFIETTELRIAS